MNKEQLQKERLRYPPDDPPTDLHLRGTGRTTRMLIEALKQISLGNPVIVYGADKAHCNVLLTRTTDIMWEYKFPSKPVEVIQVQKLKQRIQFTTTELAFDVLRLDTFDWKWMQPHPTPPDEFIRLYDHHTIERTWYKMIKELRRFEIVE